MHIYQEFITSTECTTCPVNSILPDLIKPDTWCAKVFLQQWFYETSMDRTYRSDKEKGNAYATVV